MFRLFLGCPNRTARLRHHGHPQPSVQQDGGLAWGEGGGVLESPGWRAPKWTEPLPAGGSRGTKTDTWSTTQAWCFPLREAAWRPVAPMLKARTNHASAALNGEIYVIGGEAPFPRLLPPSGPSLSPPHLGHLLPGHPG